MRDSEQAQALRIALVDSIAAEPPWGESAWRPGVLEALRKVPRHLFVPELSLERAYADEPQSIGFGQTISQPMVVALMTNALALEGHERVLEIGTGCGYQAAVLAELANEVDTVERIPELGRRARVTLASWPNVRVHLGDGYAGLSERAPFDRILLTAAPPSLPESLLEQLGEGGVLVGPLGGARQDLVRVRRRGARLFEERLGDVRFVPMLPADPGLGPG